MTREALARQHRTAIPPGRNLKAGRARNNDFSFNRLRSWNRSRLLCTAAVLRKRLTRQNQSLRNRTLVLLRLLVNRGVIDAVERSTRSKAPRNAPPTITIPPATISAATITASATLPVTAIEALPLRLAHFWSKLIRDRLFSRTLNLHRLGINILTCLRRRRSLLTRYLWHLLALSPTPATTATTAAPPATTLG